MNRNFLLIGGLSAAGFLCGFAGKRLSFGTQVAAPQANSSPTAESRAGADEPAGTADPKAKAGAARLASIRSSDTLETLKAVTDGTLYRRLALWMMDASEDDIAAYWASVRDQKNRTNDITDLVFINWTRLNPQAAIAAVAGTGTEHYAWWAWACHDPAAALAAAIAANPDRVNNVAWGIGEFHGEWLREHFDEIPESGRGNAISGLTKWDDTDDPKGVLDFLKEHGNEFSTRIFATLIRRDPWAAYDWIQANEATISSNYGSAESAMKLLVETMGETQPAALERLASQTPPGEARRRMESVLFDNLLKTDPEAALAQATATKAPRIAAERLAAVGLSLAQSDPDKALELTQQLFTIYPGALDGMTWVKYPNGASGSGSSIAGVGELVDGLIDQDPGKVLEMFASDPNGAMPDERTFSTLANKWAERDLVAFTTWVTEQTDPATRDAAASIVVNQLSQQQQFQEAAEWAMSSEKTKSNMFNIFYQWNRVNPAEAKAWLDSVDLPANQKESYGKMLQSIESQRDP